MKSEKNPLDVENPGFSPTFLRPYLIWFFSYSGHRSEQFGLQNAKVDEEVPNGALIWPFLAAHEESRHKRPFAVSFRSSPESSAKKLLMIFKGQKTCGIAWKDWRPSKRTSSSYGNKRASMSSSLQASFFQLRRSNIRPVYYPAFHTQHLTTSSISQLEPFQSLVLFQQTRFVPTRPRAVFS